ncbi:Uncharacterized protein PBTT_02104 [Plasmodiophora brassicae]
MRAAGASRSIGVLCCALALVICRATPETDDDDAEYDAGDKGVSTRAMFWIVLVCAGFILAMAAAMLFVMVRRKMKASRERKMDEFIRDSGPSRALPIIMETPPKGAGQFDDAPDTYDDALGYSTRRETFRI